MKNNNENNPNIDIPKIIETDFSLEKAIEFTKSHFNKKDIDVKKKGLVTYENIFEVIDSCVRTGYKFGSKAKETYKYTDENMIEFAQYVLDNISYNNDKLEEMLSTWKEQQIKTIYYD